MSNSESGARKVVLVLSLVAMVVILWMTRMDSLGERPLARDEFYSASAVQKVVEHGVPAFHGGGHYPRALPLQYGTAAMVNLFGDHEGSHRLLPALFGILVVPLFFLFSRRLVPTWIAVVITGFFALSSWQIEFSRFARMYTALQFFTLGFFFSYYLAFRQGRRGWRYVPHVMALAAITLHDLGALLMPLLLVAPWIVQEGELTAGRPKRGPLLVAGLATGGLALGWLVFCRIWWNSGVVDPLPADWVSDGKGHLPKITERIPLPGLSPALGFFGFAGLTLLSLAAVWLKYRRSWDKAVFWSAATFMVVSAVFHQFAFTALALGFLVWRYDAHLRCFREKSLMVALGLTATFGMVWVGVVLLAPDVIATGGDDSRLAELRKFFFGVPDFYRTGLSPWLKAMPMFTGVALVSAAFELWRIRHQPLRDLLWHPIWVVAMAAMSFGMTGTPLSVTRYWFFVYPFILMLPAMAAWHAASAVARRAGWSSPEIAPITAAASLIALLGLAEDFNPKHLATLHSREVVYRTGEFRHFSRHWYPRSDERLPALKIAEHGDSDALIILSSMLTASIYYLPEEVKPVVYMDREVDPRFKRHARHQGTMDRWSGLQLLTTPEDLEDFTASATQLIVGRVVKSRFQDLEPEEIWGERLVSCERIALSKDGRNEVLAITLQYP